MAFSLVLFGIAGYAFTATGGDRIVERRAVTERRPAAISDLDLSFFASSPTIPWGKDPFRKKGGYRTISGIQERPRLSGILRDRKSSFAILNDSVVGVGDQAAGWTVEEIGGDFVVIGKGESQVELQLGSKKAGGSK